MKNIFINSMMIKDIDVNKLRIHPKRILDKMDNYQIYVGFVQYYTKAKRYNDYKSGCIAIKLLKYMEKYRTMCDMILPMYRCMKYDDTILVTHPPKEYKHSVI